MKNSFWLLSLSVLLAVSSCGRLEDGTYRVDIFSTNDVHGKYYDLAKVSSYIYSEREALGEDNVLLIDVGDILQGDNAAYYYNYVDTVSEHIYAKAARYMKYDAAVVGNHDIEISPIIGEVPGSNRRSLRHNTRHAERRLIQMELHRLFIVQQLDLHARTQPIVLQVARRVHKVLDFIAILQVEHLQQLLDGSQRRRFASHHQLSQRIVLR